MPTPTTQELLDEARAARHALLIGQRTTRIGYGDRSVEYTAANIDALNAYIAELEAILAGTTASRFRNRISYVQPL